MLAAAVVTGAGLLYLLVWIVEGWHRPIVSDYVSEGWLKENVRQRREAKE